MSLIYWSIGARLGTIYQQTYPKRGHALLYNQIIIIIIIFYFYFLFLFLLLELTTQTWAWHNLLPNLSGSCSILQLNPYYYYYYQSLQSRHRLGLGRFITKATHSRVIFYFIIKLLLLLLLLKPYTGTRLCPNYYQTYLRQFHFKLLLLLFL